MFVVGQRQRQWRVALPILLRLVCRSITGAKADPLDADPEDQEQGATLHAPRQAVRAWFFRGQSAAALDFQPCDLPIDIGNADAQTAAYEPSVRSRSVVARNQP